ncbi:MAG: GSCFA domain-containing protein [Phycisphaerales bacterium]|nr:GSCFA domain-containing protein [Phycisphaerales bacterium]
MKFQLDINIPSIPQSIRYSDQILLIGSCFTEHIADRLAQHRFSICSNPNGILFNPLSVAHSLKGYTHRKRYDKKDLFYLNELWNSWNHHTQFSDIDVDKALDNINRKQEEASLITEKADWVMITLGSAFQYYLKAENKAVANNHRAPSQWFEKRLLEIEVIVSALSETLTLLHEKNPKAQVLFTISPVRHIRDGVIENNRSKARLLEAVHQVCSQFSFAHYFPAYELVIDVLRDYRFYDNDLVHPNFAATSYVWECFIHNCMDESTRNVMQEVLELSIAQNHRARFPQTQNHKAFCLKYAEKGKSLQKQFPFLNLSDIIAHFEKSLS